jgi:hypothetical protein
MMCVGGVAAAATIAATLHSPNQSWRYIDFLLISLKGCTGYFAFFDIRYSAGYGI